jgi:hypothetical protein
MAAPPPPIHSNPSANFVSNWIPITLANLYDAKIAALVDACDTAALAQNQENRSAGLIQGVVNEIRRKIASHQRNQLDQDPTRIPQGLKILAQDLIIAKLKTAIEEELTEDERITLATHQRNLNRIADGTDVVDMPDNPIVAPMEPLVPPPAFGHRPPRRQNELNG